MCSVCSLLNVIVAATPNNVPRARPNTPDSDDSVSARLHDYRVDRLIRLGLDRPIVKRAMIIDIVEHNECAAATAEAVGRWVGVFDHNTNGGLAVPRKVHIKLGEIARCGAEGDLRAVRGARLFIHGCGKAATHDSRGEVRVGDEDDVRGGSASPAGEDSGSVQVECHCTRAAT